MLDEDDFDPLDDILLSDEDLPETRILLQPPSYEKVKDSDIDGEFKKEKKKKIIAELFDEEPKPEDSFTITPSAVSSKSDWLELKADNADLIPTPTTTINTVSQASAFHNFQNSVELQKPDLELEGVNFVDSKIDRRRSATDKSSDLRRSKQRFKSLDLDLFDFDSSSAFHKNNQPSEKSSRNKSLKTYDFEENKGIAGDKEEDIANEDRKQSDSYIPSSNISKRFGSSQSRNKAFRSGQHDWLSNLALDDSGVLQSNGESADVLLPTWLKPERKISKIDSSDKLGKRVPQNKLAAQGTRVESTDSVESQVLKAERDDRIENEIKSGDKPNQKQNEEVEKNDEAIMAPAVAVLKEKQDKLKRLIKNQTETMNLLEREIRDTAVQLIRDQQRDNMKALLQIMSFNGPTNDKNETFCIEDKKAENMGNVVPQLQIELNKQELENSELIMKLKYSERKHKIDIAMLEDVYKCKLQIAEEREEYYVKEIQALEDEYDKKLVKRKEEENELIRVFNEKIKNLKEEHLEELKHISEKQNLRNPWKYLVNIPENSEQKSAADKDLVLKEIALEEKYKELLEFEERLNRQKQSLDTREISLNTRMEDFEVKFAKEKLHAEYQKKDLKIAQTIFEEKQIHSQRELQREKDRLASSKQELELMKENFLAEEEKLMKEKFEICAERARIEAIMNVEGDHGRQTRDVIQSRAELQGTIDELSRLKSRLESERNDVKQEQMRLKEESWRLREIEQELRLQQKNFERILRESECKREEGVEALKKARKIESKFDERVHEIEKRATELDRRENMLTQEKIELSKERDLLMKKRHQLDMLLPQLTYEEQLPFNLLNKNVFDPRIMMMKLNRENLLSE